MKKNSDISKILRQIAFLLEMDCDNGGSNSNNKSKKPPPTSSSTTINFKARSYRKASDIIANLSSNIEELYRKEGLNGLLQIPAVGNAIAAKIEEYLTTGKIQYFEKLKSKTPINLDEFYNLEGLGIGPKTVKALYDNLRIHNLSDLVNAATEGRIRSVPGFSQKKEEEILKKIQFFKKGRTRFLLGEIYPLV